MHLIYCRFFTMVLRDLGLVSFGEPVKRLMCQGMVHQGRGQDEQEPGQHRGPDEMIARYGADAVRLNILFLSPPWDQLDWKESGADGSFRFLNRVYALVEDAGRGSEGARRGALWRGRATAAQDAPDHRQGHGGAGPAPEDQHGHREPHGTRQRRARLPARLSQDPRERFVLREAVEALVAMLSPFCSPRGGRPLARSWGTPGFLVDGPWPAFDPAIAKEDEITLAVQVNGKVRGQVTVAADAESETVLAAAKAQREGAPLPRRQAVRQRDGRPGQDRHASWSRDKVTG